MPPKHFDKQTNTYRASSRCVIRNALTACSVQLRKTIPTDRRCIIPRPTRTRRHRRSSVAFGVLLASAFLGLFGAVIYGPTERATAVVCKVTGSGKHWILHTDIGLYDVDVSVVHANFDPKSLAGQIQPHTEYELTYYGPDVSIGHWTSHPNVIDARFVRGNAHSDVPICNE